MGDDASVVFPVKDELYVSPQLIAHHEYIKAN